MIFPLKNTVFRVFSGIIQNPFVSVWYYLMPFSVMLKQKWPTTKQFIKLFMAKNPFIVIFFFVLFLAGFSSFSSFSVVLFSSS